MPRLVYRAAARRDLSDIAAYWMREAGDRAAAERFIRKLTDHCEHVASLPGLLGRARPEFGEGYRSLTFAGYVLIMRYADVQGPCSHLYMVRVIHGRRDLKALIGREPLR